MKRGHKLRLAYMVVTPARDHTEDSPAFTNWRVFVTRAWSVEDGITLVCQEARDAGFAMSSKATWIGYAA